MSLVIMTDKPVNVKSSGPLAEEKFRWRGDGLLSIRPIIITMIVVLVEIVILEGHREPLVSRRKNTGNACKLKSLQLLNWSTHQNTGGF